MIDIRYRSGYELIKDTWYLAHMCKLWGVFYTSRYFGENYCYKEFWWLYIYIYELHSHRNIYHNSPTPVSCSKVLAIYSHTKHWHDIIDYVCLIVYPFSKDWQTQPDETPTWYQWLSAKQQYLQHISTILHSAFKNIWIFMKYALIKICNKNCWNYRIENIIQINIFYPKYSQTVVFDEGVSIVLLGYIFL